MPKINQEEYEVLKALDDKWKYLARNNMYGAKLEAHTSRPYKMTDSHWSNGDMTLELLGGEHLFQFIQWEDEEPYEIAELIREYEVDELRRGYFGPKFSKVNGFYNANLATWVGLNESEETEVKKGIEWLKREIHKELESWYGVEGGIDGDGINEIMLLINQLDEPEVLSSDWIDKNSVYASSDGVTEEYVHVDDLQNLLVPKQEVTIGKEDAENIVQYKEMGWTLSHLIDDYGEDARHEELLAKAWLAYPNIEVEEEQKYYAKIKGHENIGSNDKYWNYNTDMEELSIGDSEVHPNVISEYMLKATKDEWANLGITEDNADFELVEELEE